MKYIHAKRILYVEDNNLLQSLLKLLLPEYDITITSTAEDALVVLDAYSYDMFLIDINLGDGMNGIELCSRLRKIPQYAHVPILAMTAVEYENIQPYIAPEMFTDYVKKPFYSEEIRNIVRYQLGSGHPRK